MVKVPLVKAEPAQYFGYWEKARPIDSSPSFHLLAYHCLDVAALGKVYLDRSPMSAPTD